jgi:hypothetical protein
MMRFRITDEIGATDPPCESATLLTVAVVNVAVVAVVAPIIVSFIDPPVITGAVMVYVPPRIPSPTSLIWDIISRIVSFTPDGNIPSGAPFGGAALLSAGVREYFV